MSLSKTLKLSAVALVFAVFTLAPIVYANYSDPATTPPNCPAGSPGCEAPIHTGVLGQIKNGLLVVLGGVHIQGIIQPKDTTNPDPNLRRQYDLTGQFVGNVGAQGYCDTAGNNCWFPGGSNPSGNFWQTDPLNASGIKNTNTGWVRTGTYAPGTTATNWTGYGAVLGSANQNGIEAFTKTSGRGAVSGYGGSAGTTGVLAQGDGAGSYGMKSLSTNVGIFSRGRIGLYATNKTTAGLNTVPTNLTTAGTWAGYFDGPVNIAGDLTVQGTSTFEGPATFNSTTTFNGPICYEDGSCSTNGGGGWAVKNGRYLVPVKNTPNADDSYLVGIQTDTPVGALDVNGSMFNNNTYTRVAVTSSNIGSAGNYLPSTLDVFNYQSGGNGNLEAWGIERNADGLHLKAAGNAVLGITGGPTDPDNSVAVNGHFGVDVNPSVTNNINELNVHMTDVGGTPKPVLDFTGLIYANDYLISNGQALIGDFGLTASVNTGANDKLVVGGTSGNVGMVIANGGNGDEDYSALRFYQGGVTAGSERAAIYTNNNQLTIKSSTIGSPVSVLNPVEFIAKHVGMNILKLNSTNDSGQLGNTCAVARRGEFRFTSGAAGVKDTVQVCAKDAGGAYAWRTLY